MYVNVMFSAYVARTLNKRTHSHHLLQTLIRRSVTPYHGFQSSSNPITTSIFFQAFRRTLSIQSHSTYNYTHFIANFHPLPQVQSLCKATKSGVIELLKLLRSNVNPESGEPFDFLDGSGIKPNRELIVSCIWELREEWKLGFLVFKWGQKWKCDDQKAWNLMIWVLGNHKKFSISWSLIKDLYQSDMDTQQPMFIMIDRYASANEPTEAIRAFQLMEKFKLSPDQKAFYTLLDILCKHGNVEEAEEFMFVNAKLFALETEGFNIILSGWCNIFTDIVEAKRIWKEMDKCQVTPDEDSYTHLISCFSKVNNLFDSLRLYGEMKRKGWKPNKIVYNSLVYVLAHENCHEEALRIFDKMKEVGLIPDSSTYNFLIRPLCKAGKLEDARSILSRMLEENVNPTIDTYHAFLEGQDLTFIENLELLDRMMKSGNGPSRKTFSILLGKFLQADNVENALKFWEKMKECEVLPDSAHFVMMVEGLMRNGLIAKARELRAEMISNGITEDPKLTKLFQDLPQDDEYRKTKKQGMRNVKNDDRGVCVRRGKKWFRGKQTRT
uniref:pentatricopeptide repeat-containing protein At1g80880, mitochondrial n=1 Tax=Erigeron canadensis TaxID=72917 RepID=UPI001CB90436|nr:pentatricopeptide repeat-containing protein At1g80880, mitochondrial [Erigeron canadensis]